MIWGLSIITLYMTELIYYVFVIGICYLYCHQHLIKHSLIFLFIHETLMNSFTGIVRIGHVLVLSDEFNWMLPLLVGLIIVFVYVGYWFSLRKEALHQALFYDIQINLNNQLQTYRGFMDTGNQALYEGLPVIFFQKKQEDHSHQTTLRFLMEDKMVEGNKASIYFKNQWQPCFIAYIDHLEIEADCLLNYYLL